MQSDENLAGVAESLENIHRQLRDSDHALDEMLPQVAQAVSLYRAFKKGASGDSFRVTVMRKGVEEPFDFKNLESSRD